MEQKEEKTYKPRQPQHTPLYQIFNNYYDKFKDEYEEKYQKKYGFFRNIIDTTVEKYLKCGIPKYGFARVKCINCKNEFLLPFSCKSRLCPSCLAKFMLQFENFFIEEKNNYGQTGVEKHRIQRVYGIKN